MGCGASTPAEEPTKLEPQSKVSNAEMDAIRAKMAEAKAKAEETGDTGGNVAFERKFKGFKAGGGGKHEVKRAVDMSPEAVAEREAIKAAIQKKKEEREAKMNPLMRQLTRTKSKGGGLLRAMSRKSVSHDSSADSRGSGGGLVRSLTRSMSRGLGLRSSSSSGHVPANLLNANSGIHEHDNEEARKSEVKTSFNLKKGESGKKIARFSEDENKDLAA